MNQNKHPAVSHENVSRDVVDVNESSSEIILDAFKDVQLDLNFSFSTNNSPTVSTSRLPPSEPTTPSPLPSRSLSPQTSNQTHTLPRTMSFVSQFSPLIRTTRRFRSTRLSSEQPTRIGTSWPGIKRIGRSTPTSSGNKNERHSAIRQFVTEDGLLLRSSDEKASSLDSRPPRLSSSSDWDFLSSGLPISNHGESSKRSASMHDIAEEEEYNGSKENIVPLQKIELEIEGDDWGSNMRTVLISAGQSAQTDSFFSPEDQTIGTEHGDDDEIREERREQEVSEREDKIDDRPELQFDINIDKALDLSFHPAGNNGPLFTLPPVQESDMSNPIHQTITASSQSLYSTPSEGPTPERSSHGTNPDVLSQDKKDVKPTPVVRLFPHIRPPATHTDSHFIQENLSSNLTDRAPWWRKALNGFRRIYALLRNNRNSC